MPVGEYGPFHPEIRVAPLVERNHRHAPTFGLVLVALWPANEAYRTQLLEPYQRLCAATELCFEEVDVARRDGSIPPVYLYPFTALHVTIATLHAFMEQPPGQVLAEERQVTLKTVWSRVLQKASQLKEWPTAQSLQLVLDHAQIGQKAGILLWKETTGGIDAMRRCLQSVCAQPETVAELQRDSVSVDTLAIPPIVHTTYLRFYETPATPAAIARERFQTTVLPRLRSEFFPEPIHCSEVRLVCETTPYMHVQVDETVWTNPLNASHGLDAEPNPSVLQPAEDPNEERFVSDAWVAQLVKKNQQFTETFGLTLVTAWPAERHNLLESYYGLRALTELCFGERDVARRCDTIPPVYLYPFTALHISVVVLHAFHQQPPGTAERQETLKNAWSRVLRRAATLPDWPSQPLELVVESVQLKPRAGILVWNETTEGLEAMRTCVRQICAQSDTIAELQRVDISVDTLIVPEIVHTTFLRFHQVPVTPASVVLERFAATVVPRLAELFAQPIRVPDARLIIERTPYMHIPVGDTIETFTFCQ